MRYLILFSIMVYAVVAWSNENPNYCNATESCTAGCKEMYAGLLKMRFPFFMKGVCVNYGGNMDFCQCKYLGVNVPCVNRKGPCLPYNASVNFCDTSMACNRVCEIDRPGSYGTCAEQVYQDSMFNKEMPEYPSICTCSMFGSTFSATRD